MYYLYRRNWPYGHHDHGLLPAPRGNAEGRGHEPVVGVAHAHLRWLLLCVHCGHAPCVVAAVVVPVVVARHLRLGLVGDSRLSVLGHDVRVAAGDGHGGTVIGAGARI